MKWWLVHTLPGVILILVTLIMCYIGDYRWQLRMRKQYPLTYKNPPNPPKWWQVRRVLDSYDGVDDKFKRGVK